MVEVCVCMHVCGITFILYGLYTLLLIWWEWLKLSTKLRSPALLCLACFLTHFC